MSGRFPVTVGVMSPWLFNVYDVWNNGWCGSRGECLGA